LRRSCEGASTVLGSLLGRLLAAGGAVCLSLHHEGPIGVVTQYSTVEGGHEAEEGALKKWADNEMKYCGVAWQKALWIHQLFIPTIQDESLFLSGLDPWQRTVGSKSYDGS
jgi:hypothetical protein